MKKRKFSPVNCLNPYYTGSYSMRKQGLNYTVMVRGLNPYYTGSYSMSTRER